MKRILLMALISFASTTLFSQTALKIGDKAPLFNLKDNNGKQVDLKQVLKDIQHNLVPANHRHL